MRGKVTVIFISKFFLISPPSHTFFIYLEPNNFPSFTKTNITQIREKGKEGHNSISKFFLISSPYPLFPYIYNQTNKFPSFTNTKIIQYSLFSPSYSTLSFHSQNKHNRILSSPHWTHHHKEHQPRTLPLATLGSSKKGWHSTFHPQWIM